jgi:RNA polymerase sigma-70 factor, ECF subfamily
VSSSPPPSAAETAIRAAWEAGDFEGATTAALEAYGAEILRWLIDRLRAETSGGDAFSIFAEDLWKSWKGFQWRCSARAWGYTLARNAANRYAVAANRDGKRLVPLSRADAVQRAAARVRTDTLPHLRTDVKDRFRELRRQLSEEDQTILVLRVDRGLSWNEIAQVTLGGDEIDDPEAISREAARLRKRLQHIKDRIRRLAEDAGLV